MTHPYEQFAASPASARDRVFFQQGCPVCGRRLDIDVNLLGRRVYCQHCGGGFMAMDPSLGPGDAEQTRPVAVPDRIEALLEQAAGMLDRAHAE